jgi:hypothetical protein
MDAHERRRKAASARSEVDQKWERAESIDPDGGGRNPKPVREERVDKRRKPDDEQGPRRRG